MGREISFWIYRRLKLIFILFRDVDVNYWEIIRSIQIFFSSSKRFSSNMQNSTYPLNYILLKQYLTILIYVHTFRISCIYVDEICLGMIRNIKKVVKEIRKSFSQRSNIKWIARKARQLCSALWRPLVEALMVDLTRPYRKTFVKLRVLLIFVFWSRNECLAGER